MLAISFGIYMLAATKGVTAFFFEDNPKHHRVQFANALTKASEMLWVRKQTTGSNLMSTARCQGIKKSRHIHGKQFRYDVYSTPPPTAKGVL
ncbi:hypothetical protein V5799_027852 [Amblyomma americanum]|uniref:Secreted protein n=1 Tax=Amblyomma americanum TaxID=6943 RepID=A0AAQ4DEJ1_AMBAM